MEAVFSFGAVTMVVPPASLAVVESAAADIHWGAFADGNYDAALPQLSFDLGDAGFPVAAKREGAQ